MTCQLLAFQESKRMTVWPSNNSYFWLGQFNPLPRTSYFFELFCWISDLFHLQITPAFTISFSLFSLSVLLHLYFSYSVFSTAPWQILRVVSTPSEGVIHRTIYHSASDNRILFERAVLSWRRRLLSTALHFVGIRRNVLKKAYRSATRPDKFLSGYSFFLTNPWTTILRRLP